jgi:hypothetical protein
MGFISDSYVLANNYIDNKRSIMPVLYYDVNRNDHLFPLQKKVIKLEASNHQKQAAINVLRTEIGTIELSVEDQQDIIDLEEIVVAENLEVALNDEIGMDIAETATAAEIGQSSTATAIGQLSMAVNEIASCSNKTTMETGQLLSMNGEKDDLAGDHFFIPSVRT